MRSVASRAWVLREEFGSSRRGTRGGARSCCLPAVVVSCGCQRAGYGFLLTRISMAGLSVSLTPEGCALAPSSTKPPSAAGPWTGFFSGFGVSSSWVSVELHDVFLEEDRPSAMSCDS